MPLPTRVRRIAPAAFLAGLMLVLGACGETYPNSTFNHTTDFNATTDALWDTLLLWGTIVFVIVEAILIYTIFKFRKRAGSPPPQMTHGNTAMEITWTVLPIFILVIIAIPTLKAIFKTQAPAPQGALEIEVIGHQWWWEFRYPQYQFQTANEFYVPKGRTVNFTLRTKDVLHSFWVPQLGGKRDLITNRTNHLWYTPNADLEGSVWNGFCTEYCGASHANMRIRAYTVTAAEFEQWVAGQRAPSAYTPPPATPASTTPAAGGAATLTAAPAQAAPAPAAGWTFPKEQLPDHTIPKTPFPRGLEYNDALLAGGDAARGQALFVTKGACGSCHYTASSAIAIQLQGPNLAHIASRHTIAAGLYPNDPPSLARWIKNAARMKPGALMWVMGEGQIDPKTKTVQGYSKLTDQEIADIVAYLQALK